MSDREDWPQIESIFHAVADLPYPAQESYLEEHCAGRAELRSRVQALLGAKQTAGDFLEQTLRTAASDVWIERQGTIGPYRIVREIGHGGMGRVYLAERADDHYTQRVAIKIVRVDLSSQALLQRFRMERQILANLEHPCIARLLDGGATEAGAPYIVMEYVDGVTIDRYVKDHALSISDRVRLFRRVCDAVSYAHRNLVVHRDIKPGNILVTVDGVPRLLDFGIAKVLEYDTPEATPGHTHPTERVMTPQYASPEQALGKPVAVPSDVYMLGLLLYELLCGSPAVRFTSHSATDRERIICQVDPPAPSVTASCRDLAGDLDAIVMKTIRKEPEQRYSSVEQLDLDLGRWLAGLPVEARSGAWGYRTSKFVRRHRIAMAAGALAIVVLGLFLLSARRASRATQESRDHLETALALANSSLFDIHASVSQLNGSTAAQALIVQKAVESLTDLEKNGGSNTAVRRGLASAYEKLSDIQFHDGPGNLGQSQAAQASATKALILRKRLLDPAVPESLEAVAADHVRLGEIYASMQWDSEAIAAYQAGIEQYAAAKTSGSYALLASTRAALAGVLAKVGRVDPALAQIELAVSGRREILRQAPGNPEYIEGLGKTLLILGEIQRDQKKDSNAAFASFEESLSIAQKLTSEFPSHRPYRTQLASVLNNLGHSSIHIAKPERAVEYYSKSLAIVSGLSAADPNDARSSRSVAIHSTNLAFALQKLGRRQDAEEPFRRAIEVHRRLAQKNPSSLRPIFDEAFARRALGQLLVELHRTEQGREQLKTAASLNQRLVDAAPANVLYRLRLAIVLQAQGDERWNAGACAEAESFYKRAAALMNPSDAAYGNTPMEVSQKRKTCTAR